jgi:hypothetical protein
MVEGDSIELIVPGLAPSLTLRLQTGMTAGAAASLTRDSSTFILRGGLLLPISAL